MKTANEKCPGPFLEPVTYLFPFGHLYRLDTQPHGNREKKAEKAEKPLFQKGAEESFRLSVYVTGLTPGNY